MKTLVARITIAFALIFTNAEVPDLFAAASFPPDLLVTIPQGGEQVQGGSIFSYLIETTNIGGDLSADNVVLSITPPSEGTLVGTAQDGSNCLLTNGVLECPLGTIDNAEVTVVEIQWQAPNVTTTLTLTAEATESGSGLPETALDNNTATIDTPVVAVVNNNNNNNAAADAGGCSLTVSGLPSHAALYLFSALATLGTLRSWKRRR